MDEPNEQPVDLTKIKSIQNAFDDSMKVIEKNIAESITNKEKLQIMKKDMLAANKKFDEAERCLDSLKMKLENL